MQIKFNKKLSEFTYSTEIKDKLKEKNKGYIKFPVEKKNGTKRWIHAPHFLVKNGQKKLLAAMESPSVELFGYEVINGFIPGRSILDNARPHVGQTVVLSIDLKDFFPSIAPEQIKTALGHFHQLAPLVTTSKGRLPQGAPTSPMIANWCAVEGDLALVAWCEQNKINYTRYADDLTFSTIRDEITPAQMDELLAIINSSFGPQVKYAHNKVKFVRKHKQQRVTGIVVNEKLSIPKARRRQLRAFMHDAEINGLDAALGRFNRNKNHIFGEMSFLHLVHKEQAERYIESLQELL